MAEYGYDINNLRIYKTKPDGTQYHYVFDLGGNRIEEHITHSDSTTTSDYYIWRNGRHVARRDGDGNTYFYSTDHLGSTVLVTDASGEEVWNAEVSPFGDSVAESGSLVDSESLKYTGKDYDEDIGLYYFNARWYDAETGRFISEDPARDGGNWFAYVGNNPLRYTDPTGLRLDDDLGTDLDRIDKYGKSQASGNRGGRYRGSSRRRDVPDFDIPDFDDFTEADWNELAELLDQDKFNLFGLEHENPELYEEFLEKLGVTNPDDKNDIAGKLQAMRTALGYGDGNIGEVSLLDFIMVGTWDQMRPSIEEQVYMGGLTIAAFSAGLFLPAALVELGVGGGTIAGTTGSSSAYIGQKLLSEPRMIKHHIFNAFRGKSPASQVYRDFFSNRGINVHDFTVRITDHMHRTIIHASGNNWTTRWKQFIDANLNATTKQVFQFAGKLMDEYGLSGLPIEPYR